MFCVTCGSLLRPRKTPYGKWMSCPNGHSQPKMVTEAKTSLEKNRQEGKILEASDGKNILAVHDHICKRCGYGKAEMLEIGASYGDEDNVVKMKCGKCGIVEQLEGKVT